MISHWKSFLGKHFAQVGIGKEMGIMNASWPHFYITKHALVVTECLIIQTAFRLITIVMMRS